MDPIAQQAALAAAGEHGVERAAHALQPLRRVVAMQRVDLLFGKVEHRLGEHTQLDELCRQRLDRRREFTLQRAQCRARRAATRRIDQVGHRFGLRQVEPAL